MPKSAFPHWIYDGSAIADPFGYGQEAVDFIQALKHPASAAPKGRFQLYDFQERMTRRIYGPRNPDGSRIPAMAESMNRLASSTRANT